MSLHKSSAKPFSFIYIVLCGVSLFILTSMAVFGGSLVALIYPTQTPYPTSTPYSPQPTYTPEDTPTSYPLQTPYPTFTLIPTRTPTDTPTDTPEPTYTPLPTYTPEDTPTPYPTSTSYPIQPTYTPLPTYTPQTLAVYEVRITSDVQLNWCDVFIAFDESELSILDVVPDTSVMTTVPILRILPGGIANYSGGVLGDSRVMGDFPVFTVYGSLTPPGQLPTTMFFMYDASSLRQTACWDAGTPVTSTPYVIRVIP